MINHIKFYEVWDNFSEDGRSPYGDEVIGRFSDESVANHYAKGRGNWGNNAHVRLVEFDIVSSIEELVISKHEQKKREALAKLSPEEKVLLGLDKE